VILLFFNVLVPLPGMMTTMTGAWANVHGGILAADAGASAERAKETKAVLGLLANRIGLREKRENARRKTGKLNEEFYAQGWISPWFNDGAASWNQCSSCCSALNIIIRPNWDWSSFGNDEEWNVQILYLLFSQSEIRAKSTKSYTRQLLLGTKITLCHLQHSRRKKLTTRSPVSVFFFICSYEYVHPSKRQTHRNMGKLVRDNDLRHVELCHPSGRYCILQTPTNAKEARCA
jgi:hypothetical protein